MSPNRNVMIVLSYLWILFLVPLLAEKEDKEVQWHAKHGMVLFIAEILIYLLLGIVTVIPAIGCLAMVGYLIIPLGALIVRILCIVKGINGERFLIPGVSQYVEKF